MDAEVLERLLMDRALGALTPDVESLLGAYLASDPATAARGSEFETAATAARRVLGSALPAKLPPFPAVGLQKIEQSRRRLIRLRNVAGIAAALVFGVGLVAALFRTGSTAPHVGTSVAQRPPASAFVTAITAVPHDASPDGFWSGQRLYEQARVAKHAAPSRVVWESPISRPRIGG